MYTCIHTMHACRLARVFADVCTYVSLYVCWHVFLVSSRERERESICVCIEDDSKLSMLAARNSGHCTCDACISVHVVSCMYPHTIMNKN